MVACSCAGARRESIHLLPAAHEWLDSREISTRPASQPPWRLRGKQHRDPPRPAGGLRTTLSSKNRQTGREGVVPPNRPLRQSAESTVVKMDPTKRAARHSLGHYQRSLNEPAAALAGAEEYLGCQRGLGLATAPLSRLLPVTHWTIGAHMDGRSASSNIQERLFDRDREAFFLKKNSGAKTNVMVSTLFKARRGQLVPSPVPIRTCYSAHVCD